MVMMKVIVIAMVVMVMSMVVMVIAMVVMEVMVMSMVVMKVVVRMVVRTGLLMLVPALRLGSHRHSVWAFMWPIFARMSWW